MAVCCPAGSHSAAPPDTSHQPVGVWEEIAGLECYVCGQQWASATSVMLVFSDVFGPRTGRHVRVCDALSASVRGSVVVMPDLFHGRPIAGVWPGPISLNIFGSVPLLHRIRYRCGWGNVWPEVERLVEALRGKVSSSSRMAALGFCWGAWAAFKGCTSGLFSAGVGFHPSLAVSKLQCHPHNIDDETLARSLKCPILMLPAGNDDHTLKPGGEFATVAAEVQPLCRSIEYKEMKHGWVNRGTEPDCVVEQVCSADTVASAQASAQREAANFLLEVLGKAPAPAAAAGRGSKQSSSSGSSASTSMDESCCG